MEEIAQIKALTEKLAAAKQTQTPHLGAALAHLRAATDALGYHAQILANEAKPAPAAPAAAGK